VSRVLAHERGATVPVLPEQAAVCVAACESPRPSHAHCLPAPCSVTSHWQPALNYWLSGENLPLGGTNATDQGSPSSPTMTHLQSPSMDQMNVCVLPIVKTQPLLACRSSTLGPGPGSQNAGLVLVMHRTVLKNPHVSRNCY
jgi:hypothetical protein